MAFTGVWTHDFVFTKQILQLLNYDRSLQITYTDKILIKVRGGGNTLKLT